MVNLMFPGEKRADLIICTASMSIREYIKEFRVADTFIYQQHQLGEKLSCEESEEVMNQCRNSWQ
jgi:hypothetical protein